MGTCGALWAKRRTLALTLSEMELRNGSEQNFLPPEVNHSHFNAEKSNLKNDSSVWPHP